MLKYIYRDLMSMVRFLPYGIILGGLISVTLLWVADKVWKKKGKAPEAVWGKVAFCIYIAVMLIITFLSRESGNGHVLDLELFSTWGINDRNNAYVVENVLLFIPFGFLGAYAFRPMKGFFCSAFLGTVTSLLIETLQLVTGRGFFQIDDILTNALGTVIGYLVFRIISLFRK